MQQVGVVALLARYPVKSLGGEELAEVEFTAGGLAGDRQWAVYTDDRGIGSGKTTRRFRRVDGLLDWRAVLDGGVPVVESPTGERYGADDAGARLGDAVGRRLAIREEGEIPHHDESPVHLLTGASLRGLGRLLGGPVEVARFRPNVVLEDAGEGFPEDERTGCELRLVDEVVLRLRPGMPRCAMVGVPQGNLGKDECILRTLAQERGTLLLLGESTI